MTIHVSSLFSALSVDSILDLGLSIARALGLPVDSWRNGDPTKANFNYLAEVLAAREETSAEYIKAGFLSEASGDWLKLLAQDVYGVELEGATYATPTVTVTNTGGGYYEITSEGEISFKSSITEKTYHNTSTGHVLSSGATVTIDLIADEAGSDSSVGVDEIDALVTGQLGIEIESSTAATANDEETDDEIKALCTLTLGPLSSNGPPDAYESIALNQEKTGVLDVARAKTIDDSDTGEVTLFIAGASGPVAGASVTAVNNAIETWSTPLCITPTVTNATAHAFAVDATVEGDDVPADVEDQSEALIVAGLAAWPISDGSTIVPRSWIEGQIQSLVGRARVTLNAPVADIVLALGEVPTISAISVTEI